MTRLLSWRSFANLAFQLAVLALIVAAFFVRTSQVSGLSMAPHISSGEYVLVNTFAYKFAGPKRGDIVAFRHDDGARAVYIKRVIGLPGDRIRIDGGVVFIDGSALPEPYVRFPDRRSLAEVTIPDGDVYVLGDNRAGSEDSRLFGPVPDDKLIGRALAGIWPPADVGTL
ncbi:MAG TPA: signal peptidase I [Candidatus Tumulicola sp.]